MTHIDKFSIKHFTICFLLSVVGAYGMSAAIGASVTREYDNSKTQGNELVDAPQIEEADSYTMVISQGGKAVEWSSFSTNSE